MMYLYSIVSSLCDNLICNQEVSTPKGLVHMYLFSVHEQVLRYSWTCLLPQTGLSPSQYWVISSILPILPDRILTLINFTLKMEETYSSKIVSTHLQENLVSEPRKSNLKFCLFLLQTWLRNLIVCLTILIVFLESRNKLSIWEQ